MSRHTIAIMVLLGGMLSAGAASASGRFCFEWEVVYTDTGFGEDYLSDGDPDGDDPVTIPAKYARVMVHRTSPSSGTVYWYWLDADGCTPLFTTLASGQAYEVAIYTKMKRDDRYVYMMLDGEDWGSTDVDSFTFSPYYVVDPNVDQEVPAFDVTDEGVASAMPAVTQLLSRAATVDWVDSTDIWVSAWSGNGCDDGHKSWEWGSDACKVCVGTGSPNEKFRITHEFGHCVGYFNDSLGGESYRGSEGVFRTDGVGNRCDCSVVSGGDHCLNSREFTGSAQSEGFAHFVASLGMNAASTSVSTFVYYKDVMKWGSSHGGTLLWPLYVPLPPNPYVPSFDHPFAVDLSTSDNVRWVDYECDPSGEDFEHYGSEWDWMSFFWNLATDGGSSNKFSADQINDVWHGVSDKAYECCISSGSPDYTPLLCVPRENLFYGCGTGPYSDYDTQEIVGKLWEADDDFSVDEGVRNQAWDVYGTSNYYKYVHFRDTGDAAGVTY